MTTWASATSPSCLPPELLQLASVVPEAAQGKSRGGQVCQGVSTSKATRRRGKGGGMVEQEGASGCHQAVV